MAKAKASVVHKGPPSRATSTNARGAAANKRAPSNSRGAKMATKPAPTKIETRVEIKEEDKPEKVKYEDIKHQVL